MKILVSGGCGFVGFSLLESFAELWPRGSGSLELYGVDNLSRAGSELNRRRLDKLGVKFFHGDLRLWSDLEHLPGVDLVVDASANPSVLAGVDGKVSSRQLIEYNLNSTVNLLEFCRVHKSSFVLLSTSRVYSIGALSRLAVTMQNDAFAFDEAKNQTVGVSEKGISESFSVEPPVSIYGSTKLASEALAVEYGSAFNFPVWINRCGVLAGAGQFGKVDQGIVAFWLNAYLHRKPLKYIGFEGRGYQVRDFMHPKDLAALIVKQIDSTVSTSQRTFNVGGGLQRAMSLAQLSAWCGNRFGVHEIHSADEERPYDIPWVVMDATLAQRTWDWDCQDSLEEILAEVAKHAEQHPDWLEISMRP